MAQHFSHFFRYLGLKKSLLKFMSFALISLCDFPQYSDIVSEVLFHLIIIF